MSEDLNIEWYGRTVNVNKAVPLTLKDWRELEKQGIAAANLEAAKITDLIGLMFHVLHKADQTVTMDEVEGLTMTDPRIPKIVGCISAQEEKLDRPS